MNKTVKTFVFILKKVHHFDPVYLWLQCFDGLLQVVMIVYLVAFPSYVFQLLKQDKQTMKIVGMLLLGILFIWVVKAITQNQLARRTHRLTLLCRHDLLKATMSLPYAYMEDPDIINLKNEALYPITNKNSIYQFFQLFPVALQSLMTLISMFVLLAFFDGLFLMLMMLMTVVNIGVNVYFILKAKKDETSGIQLNKAFFYYMNMVKDERIAKEVRVLHQQPFIMSKVKTLFDSFNQIIAKQYYALDLRGGVNLIMNATLTIVTFLYLIFAIQTNQLTIELFLLMFGASIQFSSQSYALVDALLKMQVELSFLERFEAFMLLSKQEDTKHSGILIDHIDSIEFSHVSFHYPNKETYVLKDFCVTFDAKSSYAIVGLNGSGKTTIIKLLTRLYEPSSGVILVNGLALNEIDYDCYLKQLSVVFQDFKTYALSVKENIVLNQKEDFMLLDLVLKQTGFDKELKKMNHGIDTTLSKRFDKEGVDMSKGQEQKIAIARSLYRQSSVMILDEPTASLDPETEAQVYEQFRLMAQDTLTIFISHRLSSCRFVDDILYIEDGVIIEKGNHHQLMALDKRYACLFNTQASQYQ